MKLEVGTLNNDSILSSGQVSQMRLSEDASAMVFRMFTKSVYSDPVGTVIREIASNCFDSHIEADVDSTKNPVVVELKNELSGHYISFIDKGVGMSPDRVLNIYGTYFKSTKRQSNDQIGGFGIGGKTPLAYTQSFYVITVSEKENEIDYCKSEIEKLITAIEATDTNGESTYSNQFGTVEQVKQNIDLLTNRLVAASNQKQAKIQYIYNIYEGNESPTIELMTLKPCDDHNGTEVKIPIRERDVDEFQQKTLRQLYYFENIVFNGFKDYVTNDYSIIKGKTFLYRGETYSYGMHVCLGKVAYPIDWNALGLNSNDYQIPVAVRIEIGELVGSGVTVSRESLDYSDANRKILIKKINGVMEELKVMLSNQYQNVKTLAEYYSATEDFGRLNFPDGRSIYVGKIIPKKDIDFSNFKFNNLSIPTREEILADFFQVKLYGKKPGKYKSKWSQTLESVSKHSNIYYSKINTKKVIVKQAYLRDENNGTFYVIEPIIYNDEENMTKLFRKYGVIREKLKKDITDKLQFEVLIPKKKAEKLIDDLFEEVYGIVKSTTKSYVDLVVPDDYIQARKQNRISKEILKVGIPMKDCSNSNSTDRVEMNKLIRFTGRIYYGFSEDRDRLSVASKLFKSISGKKIAKPYYVAKENHDKHDESKGTMFVAISRQNEKYMKMLGKKAIHVDYFYQTYITRKVDLIVNNTTALLHFDNFDKNVNDFYYDDNIMIHIDNEIHSVAKKIKNFFDKVGDKMVTMIDRQEFKKHFNIDLDAIDANQFIYEKELNWLVNIAKKSSSRLRWIEFPWRINPDDAEHRELIKMVQLLIEK